MRIYREPMPGAARSSAALLTPARYAAYQAYAAACDAADQADAAGDRAAADAVPGARQATYAAYARTLASLTAGEQDWVTRRLRTLRPYGVPPLPPFVAARRTPAGLELTLDPAALAALPPVTLLALLASTGDFPGLLAAQLGPTYCPLSPAQLGLLGAGEPADWCVALGALDVRPDRRPYPVWGYLDIGGADPHPWALLLTAGRVLLPRLE